jgi:hypothetical protein
MTGVPPVVDISLKQVLDINMSGPQWLASAKGLDTTRSITLDVSTWSSAFYPQNRLPSGLYLGVITASGKYGKYDDAASDGRQTCVGFLAADVRVSVTSAGVNTATPILAALQWEGVASLAAITTINNGVALDANGKADLASKWLFVP